VSVGCPCCDGAMIRPDSPHTDAHGFPGPLHRWTARSLQGSRIRLLHRFR
jgi:hypothetical protein